MRDALILYLRQQNARGDEFCLRVVFLGADLSACHCVGGAVSNSVVPVSVLNF